MRLLRLLGLSALSGLALFASDYPLHIWPLQLVALIPCMIGLVTICRSTLWAALAGFVLGLAYTGPLTVLLEFPLLMAVGLALYLTLLWVVLLVAIYHVLRWPAPWGPLAAGAAAAVVEWIDFTALPVWGTAQCFARVWSASPEAIQIVAYTGMTGLVFVLVALQALAVALVRSQARRGQVALALALVVAMPVAAWAARWHRPIDAHVRVAAIGWAWRDMPSQATDALTKDVLIPMARKAAAAGAKVIVSPEAAFDVTAETRSLWLEELGALARELRVTLAIGYFHKAANDNRITFFAPSGELVGEYRKTHLIPQYELYTPGDGTLVLMPLGVDKAEASGSTSVMLGGMICQDDNFTDLSRAYGQAGAAVVAVPTNDWLQVKDYHFENSIFRTVESGYGIVRAATNGVSAIVSARGEVLASRDHFAEGPGWIIADLPIYQGETLYSRAGNWLPIVALFFLVIGFVARLRLAAHGLGVGSNMDS